MSVVVTHLHSILVGVVGDFHFQAVRIYAQEKKLLHGYCVYEVTVQPAGGMCSIENTTGSCPAPPKSPSHLDVQHHPKHLDSVANIYCGKLFSVLIFPSSPLAFKEITQNLL
jgi:hypothetical protein